MSLAQRRKATWHGVLRQIVDQATPGDSHRARHVRIAHAAERSAYQIRTLLRAHDEAFTNHDLNGIMACLTEKAAIMGTGPGEVWSGPEEIKVAYEHFFEDFDKGEQKFEYQFKIGGVTSEMGWLMTARNVNGKRMGKSSRSLSISP